MPGRFSARLAWQTWALLGLCAAQVLFFALCLVGPDLDLAYRFLGGDSLDWISNGLSLAGEDTRQTGRPLLLPAMLAALARGSGLRFAPLVLQVAFAGLALGVYRLAAIRHHRTTALTLACLLLVSSTLERFSFEIMADILAAALMVWSAACWLRARERPGLQVVAGTLGGLAGLAQAAGLLLLPAYAWSLGRFRRSQLRRPAPWIGSLLLVGLPAAGAVWLRSRLGGVGIVSARQMALLRPHLPPLAFYSAAACSLFGWPAVALACGGAALRSGGEEDREEAAFALVLVAAAVTFFGLLYDYPARRMGLYVLPGAVLLAARGLDRLGSRARWTVTILALAVAAWPTPGSALEETSWVLWPWPTVIVRGGGGLATPTLGEAWRTSAVAQAWDARRATAGFVPFDATPYRGDLSALVLAPAVLGVEERSRIQSRLGNALGKRVKVVAEELVPMEWWGWRHAQPVGTAQGFAFWRLHLAGDPASYLLVRPQASQSAALPAPGADPDPRRQRIDLERARWVEGQLRGTDPLLAVCLVDATWPDWARILALRTRTSSLFVLGPADVERLPPGFATPPGAGRREHRGLVAWRGTFRGWDVLVVRAAAAGVHDRDSDTVDR